jgi:hypothetical protein
MKIYFELSGAEPDTWVKHSASFLRGEALDFYTQKFLENVVNLEEMDGEGSPTTLPTWEEHSQILLERLIPPNFGKDALGRLRDLTQRGTVQEYTKTFAKIHKYVVVEGVNETSLMYMYILGSLSRSSKSRDSCSSYLLERGNGTGGIAL